MKLNPGIKDIQSSYRNDYVRASFHQAKLRDLQLYESELYYIREYYYLGIVSCGHTMIQVCV